MAYTFGQNYRNRYCHYLEASAEHVARYKAWRDASNVGRLWRDEVGFFTGHPVPEEYFPKRRTLTKGRRLFDYNSYGNICETVSARFKDAVEAIEPGVHQFVPVKVLRKDGAPYDEPFWSFSIATLIDAVNPVLGGLDKRPPTPWEDPENYHYTWTRRSGEAETLAVYADRIAGRAVWRDNRFRP